jgi:hypothetical protein
MPGKDMRTGMDLRRPIAVLLLVAIAVVGLRAGGAFSADSEQGLLVTGWHVFYWIAISIGGALVLLELVVVGLWLFWARKGGPSLPLPQRRRNPLWLLVLALEIFALARIISILHNRSAAAARRAGAAAHGGAAAGGHLFLPPASSWPLLSALVLAALVAVGLTMPARRVKRLLDQPEATAEPQQQPLLDALAAGAKPLREDADPRTAIVNCYAAMEESLAAAGSPPTAADTPAEVLARAGAGGLIRSAAATTLTGLFRRARYSTHPITEADRTAAQHALDRLREELRGADPHEADIRGPA